MTNSTLMIRVQSLKSAVPVNVFLRAAHELSFVAAEVGRIVTRTGGPAPKNGAAPPLAINENEETVVNYYSERSSGWTISQAESLELSLKAPGGYSDWQTVALVIAPPVAQQHVVPQIREGIRSIHAGNPQRPEGFNDAALRSLRRAAALSGKSLRVSLSSGHGEGEAIALDSDVVTQIDSWLAGRRDAIGSVEGKLDVISVHNRLRFTIYGGRGERIECLFNESLLPQVKGALGERVSIRGLVAYRKDGVPATVEAQWLRLLKPRSRAAMEALNN